MSVRATPQTIVLPMIDATNRPARKSLLAAGAFTVLLSKDGAATAAAANVATIAEIGTTGRYLLNLTAAETACERLYVFYSATGCDPGDMAVAQDGDQDGTAAAGSAAGSVLTTSITDADADFHKGSILRWTSGTMRNQQRAITGYSFSAGTATLTFSTPFTRAPSTGDAFVIISR